MSEPGLVAAVRAGDDRAFERLYDHYRGRIFAFILSRVQDHGRAEDIAQEVFLSAVRRLRSDDRPVAFKPWIYEIARNACVDEYRRRARSHEVPLDEEPQVGPERGLPSSAARSPVAAVAVSQQMADLRGAFGGLSEHHHRLLVMRELEGLTYEEIGERLGISRQMVESGLFRARRKLTEEYEELASGRRCEQVQDAIEAGSLLSAAALGVRVRRRVARHLAHCQPCRHVALMAGVDPALVRPRSIPAKIAALLPFPLPLVPWPWRRGARPGAPSGPAHSAVSGSLHAAASTAQPASSLALGPTVAAVAALVVAGAGGGILGALAGSSPHHRPAPVVRHVGGSVAPGAAGTAHPGARLRAGASGRAGHGSLASSRRHHGDGRSSGGGSAAGGGPASGGGAAGSPSSGATGAGASAGGQAGIGQTLRGAGGTVGGALASASGTADGVAHSLSGQTAGVVGGAVQTVDNTLQDASGAAQDVVGGTVQAVGGAVQQAGGTVQQVGSAVTQTGDGVQQLGGALQPAGSAVSGAGAAGSGAGSAVSDTGSTVSAAGSTVTGAVGAVTSGTTAAVDGIAGQLSGSAGG